MIRSRSRAVLAALLVVTAVVVMVRLSIWQWDKARITGRLLNYTYAVEWLLFAGLTVAGVIRLWREGRRAAAAETAEPGRPVAVRSEGRRPVVGPPLAPGEQLEEVTWIRLRRRLGLGGIAGGTD